MAQAEAVEAPDANAPTQEPRPIREYGVTFTSEGVELSATVWEREPVPVAEPPVGKDGKPGKAKKVKEGDPEAPPRAFCILVHGLLSDRQEFGDLGRRLAEAGFGAIAIDIKGHGKSQGPRGVITSLDSIVADILAAQDFLSKRHEQWDFNPQQWAIIGHSLGAVAALRAGYYFHQESEIVAIAPPRTIAEEIGFFKRLGYQLAYNAKGKGVPADAVGPTVPYEVKVEDIIQSAPHRQSAKRLGFLQTRMPLRNYPALMGFDGETIARNLLDPTATIVVASKDRVVSNAGSRAIYEALPTSKQWWVVEGSGHSILMDAQAETFTERLIAYLEPRLGAFPEVREGHTKR